MAKDEAQGKKASSSKLFSAGGSETSCLSDVEIKEEIFSFLDTLGEREDVLILPPDFTRFHSQAGKLTQYVAEYYRFIPGRKDEDQSPLTVPNIEIMPALGTHHPMTSEQILKMFGNQLHAKEPSPFLVHNWREDVVTIGHCPSEMVKAATNGLVEKPWPAQLNKEVWKRRHHDPSTQPHKSLVLSIGQVVPHEVMGMANFNKNLFVGVGGIDAIDLSHFVGAVIGMENMMGRANNPLRSILNHASEEFLHQLDLWYILTVVGTNSRTGNLEVRGLYIGNDIECYNEACKLSLKVNFTILEKPPKRAVVYLDEEEFHSTWLGNKAIYRMRMAVADGGEIIILAPGVKRFGEDDHHDQLIRKHGYLGTPHTMKAMEEHPELKSSLSTVAHLIHGSSEGRFAITYCPGHLSQEEIEGVGFKYADLSVMKNRYDVKKLRTGWQKDDDGEFFFVSNPALGLWAVKERFET